MNNEDRDSEGAITRITDFVDRLSIHEKYKNLIEVVLEASITCQDVETIYKYASEEFEISQNTVKINLAFIKTLLRYGDIHPDDFLRRLIKELNL